MAQMRFHNGKILFVDAGIAMDSRCCCDCPVTPWLPPSWPNGGMLETYQATGTHYSYQSDTTCTSLTATWVFDVTLTAVEGELCTWRYTEAGKGVDVRTVDGGDWIMRAWQFGGWPQDGGQATRTRGLTIIGAYATSGCMIGSAMSGKIEGAAVS